MGKSCVMYVHAVIPSGALRQLRTTMYVYSMKIDAHALHFLIYDATILGCHLTGKHKEP